MGVPKTDQSNLQNITRERSDAKPPMQVELSPSQGHKHTQFSLQYENIWRIHYQDIMNSKPYASSLCLILKPNLDL